jgi:hypothetical protein
MILVEKIRNRVRTHAWFHRPWRSDLAPIVIGGCGRSGTTILRVILDTHSRVACGPESNLFTRVSMPHGDPAYLDRLAERFDMSRGRVVDLLETSSCHAEFIERFFERYALASGKSRIAEKTPNNVHRIGWVFRHFPRARFVHMIRDGRDAVCSLRTHPRHRVVDGRLVPVETDNPIDMCVERWVTDVAAGLRWRGDPRYFEVRYEDLVRDREATLRELMLCLGLEWEPALLDHDKVKSASRDATRFPQNPEANRPVYSSAIGRWQTDLSAAEKAAVERRAGRLLRDLGYSRAS